MMSSSASGLLDYFGAAYLINLPERTDRLSSARRQLSRIGWSGVQIFGARRFEHAAGFPSAGARGCFQSHLDCLRLARQAELPNVLILEDDISFTSAIPALSESICTALDASEWDFVYFGHEQTGEVPRAHRWTWEVRLDPYTGPVLTTHFYGINGRIIPRLIGHLEAIMTRPPGDPEGGPMTIDGAYYAFRLRNRDVQTAIATPKLGWQRPSRSDLSPNKLDALILARPLASALRNVKHLIIQWRS
jgi:hypothetical protein